MRILLALLALSVLPAAAQAPPVPLTAQQFETYATGKTLTYAYQGQIFGTEQYLPNRKVRWAFSQKECQNGFWYEKAGSICFVYDGNPDVQCWHFWQGADGLRAEFDEDPAGTALSEVQQTTKPLICAGPDVGA